MASASPKHEGFATCEGSEHYAERFVELDPDHFRMAHGMVMSSIGIGTYLGEPDDATDAAYEAAITAAVCGGCNVIDTAINYRFQRSERSAGRALKKLIANGFTRPELVVCTKGGFLSFDADYPRNPRQWVEDTFIKPGIITVDDIVAGSHCMAPAYLKHQVAQSLENLGLQTIDVYYVHNPETQLREVNEEHFYKRLEMAFAALEEEVAAGRICCYGTATWDGYLGKRENGEVLQLDRVMECAMRAGGHGHHLHFIQLPVNLAMPEALSEMNQTVNGREMTALEAAAALNLSAVASASLLQGQLSRSLPETVRMAIPGLPSDAVRALQFARSAPGITTALVGMSKVEHVRTNLDLATLPPMESDQFGVFFGHR